MKEIYAWVPWFQELAGKIAEGGEAGLIERAKRVEWHQDDPALLRFRNENIDPFSFIYTLASKNDKKLLKPVYRSVSKIFDINCERLFSEDSRKHGFYFPTPPGIGTLFHRDGKGNPVVLWKLFKQAMQGSDAINADDFANTLKIKNVGVAKLTQTLFLINPNDFMPIDKGIFKFNDALDLPPIKEARKQIEDQDNGWENYQSMLKKFKSAFPECRFYEINTVLYRMMQWKNDDKVQLCQNFYQVSTNVCNDDSNYWDGVSEDKDFSKNNHVFTGGPGVGGWDAHKQNQSPTQGQKYYPLKEPQVGDIIFVRYGNNTGCAVGIVFHNDYATGLSEQREVNEKMRIHVLWLNKNGIDTLGLSGRIPGFYDARKYGVYDHFKNHESYKDTCAFIEKVRDTENGEIHPENGDNQMKHPLNNILYGPPGTGKTWNTVNHALAIIEGKSVAEFENEDRNSVKQRFDQLKKSGQIEMVTFHQNFAYEDFIEGIKPVLGDASGDLDYEIVDGVFKRICERAASIKPLHQFEDAIEKLKEECSENPISMKSPSRGKEYSVWHEEGRAGFFVQPTEGKRFCVSIKRLTKFYNQSRRGIAKTGAILNYLRENYDLDDEQLISDRQNYVLIIDEINRGNIAKIFGELITLIEDTKRIGNKDEMTVALPYSSNSDDEDDSFGVPNNLYIIGTMNTADRSIALLDTALRRRFDFIEMMPESNHPLISNDIDGVNCRQLLAMINKRITALLDREHQIGHSYFIGVESMEELATVFQHRIVPLLQEYFYDDWAKIELVLNKNGFVTTTEIDNTLFSNTELVDTECLIYELIGATSSKWNDSERYKKIYATTQTKSDDGDGE